MLNDNNKCFIRPTATKYQPAMILVKAQVKDVFVPAHVRTLLSFLLIINNRTVFYKINSNKIFRK